MSLITKKVDLTSETETADQISERDKNKVENHSNMHKR